jgi:hypothetical protein
LSGPATVKLPAFPEDAYLRTKGSMVIASKAIFLAISESTPKRTSLQLQNYHQRIQSAMRTNPGTQERAGQHLQNLPQLRIPHTIHHSVPCTHPAALFSVCQFHSEFTTAGPTPFPLAHYPSASFSRRIVFWNPVDALTLRRYLAQRRVDKCSSG